MLDSAKSATQHSQLEKVKTSLEGGETLSSERQKHILLVKSDYGQATADEYKKHILADDSDDKKQIFKAESRSYFCERLKEESSVPAEYCVKQIMAYS